MVNNRITPIDATYVTLNNKTIRVNFSKLRFIHHLKLNK